MRFWITAGLAVAAALALLEWPYAYYQILRLAVCAGAAFLAFTEAKNERRGPWIWSLAGTALLFNPFIPIHLEREAWIWLDLILALFLASYAWVLGSASLSINKLSAEFEAGVAQQATVESILAERAARPMPAVTKQLSERCLESEDAGTADDGISALTTVAIKRLRQSSPSVQSLEGDDAVLLDGLRTLIVTDAVTQVTGGDWEMFAFETYLIQNAGKEFSGHPDDVAIRIGVAFKRVLDLQLFLSQSATASALMTQVGKSVMRWCLSGDEAHLVAAREAACALGPEISRFREEAAN